MKQNIVDVKKLASMTPLDAIEYLGECGAYNDQANEFLRVTGSTLQVRYLRTGLYFGETDVNQTRDIYEFRIQRGGREYVDTFGDSLQNTWDRFAKFVGPDLRRSDSKQTFRALFDSNTTRPYMRAWNAQNESMSTWDSVQKYDDHKPKEYSILSGMQTSEPGTFDDFIAEFGYEITSKATYENAQRTYEDVKNQYAKLCALYNEKELQALASIS